MPLLACVHYTCTSNIHILTGLLLKTTKSRCIHILYVRVCVYMIEISIASHATIAVARLNSIYSDRKGRERERERERQIDNISE